MNLFGDHTLSEITRRPKLKAQTSKPYSMLCTELEVSRSSASLDLRLSMFE